MKTRSLCRVLGISALSFGLGVLFSCFLPKEVLVVIQALLIAAVGFFYFFWK